MPIVDFIKKQLSGGESESRGPKNYSVALAAMLVQLAKTDGDYSGSETSVIKQVLRARLNLEPDAIDQLLSEAERLEERTHDTVSFTRMIKDEVSFEGRHDLVRDMWRVVLADDRRDHEENTLMRLAANLLGVSDKDSALSRQEAQALADER